MTTMGQALAAVRRNLDETTARAWTDTEIRGWVNEAVAEIARRTMALETSADVSVSAEDVSAAMPADVLTVNRLEWRTSDGTRQTNLEIREKFAMDSVWSAGQDTTMGTPQYAAPTGFPPSLTFQLYPIPSEDGTVRVYYYKAAPTLATDTSQDAVVLSVPSGWDDLIYDYATQAAQRRDNNPLWQTTRQVFEEKLQQMWTAVQAFHNHPGVITPDANSWDEPYGWW